MLHLVNLNVTSAHDAESVLKTPPPFTPARHRGTSLASMWVSLLISLVLLHPHLQSNLLPVSVAALPYASAHP